MKVVYIAGKFRAGSHWGVVQNVREAERVALCVWRAGAAALCPHLNCANFEGAMADSEWLAGGVELLRRCDAVVLLGNWVNSIGTKAEIVAALEKGLPIFVEEEVSPNSDFQRNLPGGTRAGTWMDFLDWLRKEP